MRDPIHEDIMQIAVAIGHVQYLHVLPFEYRAALSEAIAGALMKEREERDRLREALKLISAPRDCGCSPSCQCNTEEALKIEVDYLKDLARAALNPAGAS